MIPNVMMFIFFAQGYKIYEPSLMWCVIEALLSVLLMLWFLYVIISTIRNERKSN